MIWSSLKSFINTLHINDLAAPQGFEPRYADPESAVLPLNEGAAIVRRMRVTLRCFDSMGQGRMGQPWGREEWVNRLLSGSDPYYGLSRGFVALFCNSAVTVLSLLT